MAAIAPILGRNRWAVAAIATTLAVPLTALLPIDGSLAVAARLLPAALAVAFIPGLLIALWVDPDAKPSPLRLTAMALAISFPVIQLLTIASLLLHIRVGYVLWVLLAINLLLAARLLAKGPSHVAAPTVYEYALLAGMLVIAARLFQHGSPVDSWEDSIHIGVVRRLLTLSAPNLLDAYIIPNFVYTYPFPGLHFLIALVSSASGLDPILVYHKLRFLWGPGALLFVYAGARLLFPTAPRMAFASAWVAVLFVLTGSFADVPNYYWAQLVPFTHISDLSMNFLLPGSLLLLLSFLTAGPGVARNFYFFATVASAAALTMVHPREAVQFAVYLVAFTSVAMIPKWSRGYALRAAAVMAAVIAIGLAYSSWHAGAIAHVSELESEFRRTARAFIAAMPVGDYFDDPYQITFRYFSGNELFFLGWNWLVLLLGPLVLVAGWPRSSVAVFVAASVLGYAAILRFPIIGVTYAATTYDEILVSPVRNVVYFMYLLAGAAIYLVVAQAWRLKPRVLSGMAIMIAGGALYFAWGDGAAWLAPHPARFLLALVVLYAAALVYLLVSKRTMVEVPGAMPAFLLLSVALGWATAEPKGSVLRPAKSFASERQLIEGLVCKPNACAPPVQLVEWARADLSHDAVFALNIHNEVFPSLLMPQRLIAWPGPGIANYLNRNNFPVFYQHYDRTMAAFKVTPFFNDQEGLDSRLDFVRDLGPTHVLVDPSVHPMMTGVLGRWPDVFQPIYDAEGWAVYAITAP